MSVEAIIDRYIQDLELKQACKDFLGKREYLASKFELIPPKVYLDRIYSGKGRLVVILGTTKTFKGTVIRLQKQEIWKLSAYPNVYMPYVDFVNDYYHSRTTDRIRAFVVDCDAVNINTLEYLLKYVWDKLPLLPSYIVNSGKGVHFVYALDMPYKIKDRKRLVNDLNTKIQETYAEIGRLDKHPISHPYRFPGFATKLYTKAEAFITGKHYSLQELIEAFMGEVEGKKQIQPQQGKILVFPKGSKHFYSYVLRSLMRRPPIPGRRNKSFFALGIVSWKCMSHVSKEEAVKMARVLYERMELLGLTRDFSWEEALKAFNSAYNPKATTVRWKTICDLLDWEYRPNKRNGRSREQHLEYLQGIRKLQKKEKEKRIKELLAKGYSKAQIARELGVTRYNLYKSYGYLFQK